jgi:hypothetical protein
MVAGYEEISAVTTRGHLTREIIDALIDGPPVVQLWPTAGRAVGSGRAKTYEMARLGQFPVPTLRVGQRIRVRRADLLRYLGVADPHAPAERSA